MADPFEDSEMGTEDFCLNFSPAASHMVSPLWNLSPPRDLLSLSPMFSPPYWPSPDFPSSPSSTVIYEGSNQFMDNLLQNHHLMLDPLPSLNGDSQRPLPSTPNSIALSVGTSSVVYQQKTQQHHQPMASFVEHTDNGLDSGGRLDAFIGRANKRLVWRRSTVRLFTTIFGVTPEKICRVQKQGLPFILHLHMQEKNLISEQRIYNAAAFSNQVPPQLFWRAVLMEARNKGKINLFRKKNLPRDHTLLQATSDGTDITGGQTTINSANMKQSLASETPSVINQEIFPHLTCHNRPSVQALMATGDANSVDQQIPLPQILPTAEQDNSDVGFSNDAAETFGMRGVGIGKGVREEEEAHLNSGCSGKKGKRKVSTIGRERGNNVPTGVTTDMEMHQKDAARELNVSTKGVPIEITLDEIFQVAGKELNDAAETLDVSRSRLKRVCRTYGIPGWPPRNIENLVNQSRPKESPVNDDILPSDHQPSGATDDTSSVRIMFAKQLVHARTLIEEEIEHSPEKNQRRQHTLWTATSDAGQEMINRQSLPNETPAVVDQARFPVLTYHNGPSDQALMAPVDTNSAYKEIPQPQLLHTVEQEHPDAGLGNDAAWTNGMEVEGAGQVVSEEAQLKKRRRKVKTRGGERGNNVPTGVTTDAEMHQKDAARELNVGPTKLRQVCREQQKHISQSCPNESSGVVGQERNAQLNLDQDSEDFGNDEVEASGMRAEGTGEGEMEEDRLNSGCLGNGKSKVRTPVGNRGSKKTNGVKIVIPLEDILRVQGEKLKDAAKTLKVSRSTIKRSCREHGISRWPPRNIESLLTNQSHPKESPVAVDHEGAQQLNRDILPSSDQVLSATVDTSSILLNCDILPSDQALRATVDTSSILLKVRCVDIYMIPLSRPWKMSELEQKLEKRRLKSGTYSIKYKYEGGELVTIVCDEDLQTCISSSRAPGTNLIELFLEPRTT